MIKDLQARYAVAQAVARGELHPLTGGIPCVDCGKPATEYDHRDYDKPLEVVPVCRGCNARRGPAKNRDTFIRIVLYEEDRTVAQYIRDNARKQCRKLQSQVYVMLRDFVAQQSIRKPAKEAVRNHETVERQ